MNPQDIYHAGFIYISKTGFLSGANFGFPRVYFGCGNKGKATVYVACHFTFPRHSVKVIIGFYADQNRVVNDSWKPRNKNKYAVSKIVGS